MVDLGMALRKTCANFESLSVGIWEFLGQTNACISVMYFLFYVRIFGVLAKA